MAFQKGNKTSPGRTRGSLNKKTIWQKALIKGEKDIIDAIVSSAQKGSGAAQTLCSKYLGPTVRRREPIDLPAINSPADILEALKKISEYQAAGILDEREAASHIAAYSAMAGIMQHTELAQRVRDLEAKINAQS